MTNKQRFRARIADLQEKGFDIGFDNAYGGDAITNKTQSKNLSTRAGPGQLLEVLAGVEAGIALERQRVRDNYQQVFTLLKITAEHSENAYLVDEVKRYLDDLARIPHI